MPVIDSPAGLAAGNAADPCRFPPFPEMVMSTSMTILTQHLAMVRQRIQQPAGHRIPKPWLSVSYGQHYASWIYTWDAYHMALSFAHHQQPRHLRDLVDNLMTYQKPDGFTPSMIHMHDGPRLITPPYHAQPYLCQAACIYHAATGDGAWAREVVDRLAKYLGFFDEENATPLGLYRYRVSWYGGFDNEIVHALLPPDAMISSDLPALLHMEYRALAALLDALGQSEKAGHWRSRATQLAHAINTHLWHEPSQSYAPLNLFTGKASLAVPIPGLQGSGQHALQSCSNLLPLYARIATRDQASAMIERYVLHADHFWSPHGIRSLSRSSEYYNNARWGNPPRFGDYRRLTNSNWQGPVWFPLCYFMTQALAHYGYADKARELADHIVTTLAQSVETHGSMAENFDGDTGHPLYCRHFASWNLLADSLHDSLATGRWVNDPIRDNPA